MSVGGPSLSQVWPFPAHLPRGESGQDLGRVQNNNPGNPAALAHPWWLPAWPRSPHFSFAISKIYYLFLSLSVFSQLGSSLLLSPLFDCVCVSSFCLPLPFHFFSLSLILCVAVFHSLIFSVGLSLLTVSPLLISLCLCLARLHSCLSPSPDLVCLPGQLLSLSLVLMCLLPLCESVYCLCSVCPFLPSFFKISWLVGYLLDSCCSLSLFGFLSFCHCFLPYVPWQYVSGGT